MKIRLSAWGDYAQDVRYILAALGDPWKESDPFTVEEANLSAYADEKNFYVIIKAHGLRELHTAEAGWQLLDELGRNEVQLIFPIKRTETDGAIIEGFTQPVMKGRAKGTPILKDATEIKDKITEKLKLAAIYEITKNINYDTGTTSTSYMSGRGTYNITQAVMNAIDIDVIIRKLNEALKTTSVNVTKETRTLRGSKFNVDIAIEKGAEAGSAKVYLQVPKQSGRLTGVSISSPPAESVISMAKKGVLSPGEVPEVILSNGQIIQLIANHIPKILADMFKDSPPTDSENRTVGWNIILNGLPENDKRSICDDLTRAIKSTSGRPGGPSPDDGTLEYGDI